MKYEQSDTLTLSESEDEEFPTSYLHVMIFLAQLYDYERDTTKALYYIDRAMQHTPTYIDPYMVKSKIYKVLVVFFML